MALIEILIAAAVVYVISDIYRRLFAERRQFRVALFLLEATHRAMVESGHVSKEAIYDAQKRTLYSMSEDEMNRTRADLAKEGIVIEK